MACGDFSLWYNILRLSSKSKAAMACGDFSLWYNDAGVEEYA